MQKGNGGAAPLTTKSLTARLSHSFIPFVESDVQASSLLSQKSLRARAPSSISNLRPPALRCRMVINMGSTSTNESNLTTG